MPTLVIKSPSRMAERYQLGWLSVTIGPTDLHDIRVFAPVQAEIYSEEGRFYLRRLTHTASSQPEHDSSLITYDDEGVYSPVLLKHKGRIRIGATVIDFQEVDGRDAAQALSPYADAGGEAAGPPAGGLSELLENEGDLAWLAPEIMRRAAACYEQAGMIRDAAQCWLEAGETSNAADIYLQLNDFARAAPLFMSQGRYREAMRCYRQWFEDQRQKDPAAEVRAQLGMAACLTRLGEQPAGARQAYLNARRLVEKMESGSALTAGRCWEALGDYGVLVGRLDLIQIAYEQALGIYGDRYNRERVRVAREYLKAAGENHLLASQLEELLAEWAQPVESGAVQNLSTLDPNMGARFGDWVLWRTKGKLILLIHKESRTRIEIWTDSPGWFMWARRKQSHMIRTNGTSTVNSYRQDLNVYFDAAPARTLGSERLEVDNYLIDSSPETLVLTNVIKSVHITLRPDRPHFQFTGAEGQITTIGRSH